MSDSNTSNEPERTPPGCCSCPSCVAFRAKTAARAPETATEYLAREQAEIFAARRASNDESDRLRTFLKDCCCPCCDARARLRALSYERAYNSAAPIHCASTDRRDYPADPSTLVRGSDEERLAADAAAAEKEFRSSPERYHETDTDAR